MQPIQVANLARLVRKGFAMRVPKIKHPSAKIRRAYKLLVHDDDAKMKAQEFCKVLEKGDGPKLAAELLNEKFGDKS
jgi:hypothetical protein